MTPFRLPLLLGSAALLLAACTGQPTNEVRTMVEESQLRGEAWSVTSLNGEDVTDATVTLNFHQPGQVAGKAACNNYLATYVQNEDSFTIPTGGVTRPISIMITRATPNQIGSSPSDMMIGKVTGSVISIIEMDSMNMPRTM